MDVNSLIADFAESTSNCKSPDGDWQGDGWGICWLDNKSNWSLYKSLLPIWEDHAAFSQIPPTKYLLIHARGASFPGDKDSIHYNQPYHDEKYAFVFNGLLKNVKIPFMLDGKIGAQKIWSLLKKILSHENPQSALIKLQNTLLKYSASLCALNIGLCDKENIFSINLYEAYPDYYKLHYYSNQNISIISSVAIPFGDLVHEG